MCGFGRTRGQSLLHCQFLFPDFYEISNKKGCSLAECWVPSSFTWDLGLRRNLFDTELLRWASFIEKIEFLQLGNEKERTNCGGRVIAVGFFRINQLSLFLSNLKLKALVVSYIWIFKVPKKVKFFLRILLYRSINTAHRLQRRVSFLVSFSFNLRAM